MSLTKEQKIQRKKWKKGLKRAKQPWKAFAAISALVGVVATVGTTFYSIATNAMSIVLHDNGYVIENVNKDKQYFKSDFAGNEERTSYEKKLVEQIEGEGAVLLLNKNNTLPLDTSKVKEISCFSTSSVNIVYGGTGSGGVDTSKAPSLKRALTDQGFKVNNTLWDFYVSGPGSNYTRSAGSMFDGSQSSASECPWSEYTNDVKESLTGTDAIVVLSRVGGEGSDLPCTSANDQLVLDSTEREMLKEIGALKKSGKLNSVTVLLNSSNAIQLDFLKDEVYGIDAALWIGGVGSYGLNSVAKILNGKVNPSGCLPDTFLYENRSSPAMMNFSTQVYENADKYNLDNNQKNYVVYQEGIYVGYHYYETRYEDFVNNRNNVGTFNYNDAVAYPFGYGSSYTTFKYDDYKCSYDKENDEFNISVKVTNTGKEFEGKKTVQVYLNAPYTEYDIAHGVEKSSVQLVGFNKTKSLKPGESEIVKIKVERRDLASYDNTLNHDGVTGGYLLEKGDYYLTIGEGAHDAINNALSAKGVSKVSTQNKMDKDGNSSLVYKYTLDEDVLDYSISKNGTVIQNQFDDGDLIKYKNLNPQGFKYVSRSNWKDTLPTTSVKLEMNDNVAYDLRLQKHENKKSQLPTTGKDSGIKAIDMMNVSLDDKKWDTFVEQATVEELVDYIGDAFHLTHAVTSLNLPATRQENGPQGYTGFFGLGGNDPMAITSCDILAATFNTELAEDVGRCIGNDCLYDGISCLYGPGNNIHRSPYSGRNFEYYSEDGFLSGMISTYENHGIISKGVNVEIKHFVVNDCEENRGGLNTWLNEQALREIYLRGFQRTFEDNHEAGVMTSYSRIGTNWCGTNKNLLTNVLRGEWGSTGFIISDNAYYTYMNGPDGVLAGTTLFDAMMEMPVGTLSKAKEDGEVVKAMQEAMKYNVYNIIHSSAINGMDSNTIIKAKTPAILSTLTITAAVSWLIFVICEVLKILRGHNYKKNNGKTWLK